MDCIDRDLLLKDIDESVVFTVKSGFISPEMRGARKVIDRIKNAPTADVVEVKHGEWKLMGTEKFMDGSYSSKFFCSKCLREIGVCHEHKSDSHKYAKSMYPYCHCGAKMDGNRREGESQ